MASLIEELIMVLGEEERIYSEIIPLAEKKTRIIVKNDLQSLTSITEEEQALVSRISKLEKKTKLPFYHQSDKRAGKRAA